MSAQVAADLRAAADYIAEHGWVRLEPETEDGRCCMIGAVIQVAPGLREDNAYRFLRSYIGQEFGIDGVSVWNDFHAQDADEVIAALRAAADRAEAA